MKNTLPILATLLVFGWLAADKTLLSPPAAIADEYHAHVRDVAAEMPRHFGDWLGVEAPVPAGAVKLLKPNVLISRRFQNIRTGESVSFLFVQVTDTRDILGHYPPACYPAQGWVLEQAQKSTWQGEERVVEGTSYEFGREALTGTAGIAVANFLVLSDGTTCRDMDAVEETAKDRLLKAFGAAQVQLVFDGSVPAERRSEVTEEFIRFSEQVLKATGSGESYVTEE